MNKIIRYIIGAGVIFFLSLTVIILLSSIDPFYDSLSFATGAVLGVICLYIFSFIIGDGNETEYPKVKKHE